MFIRNAYTFHCRTSQLPPTLTLTTIESVQVPFQSEVSNASEAQMNDLRRDPPAPKSRQTYAQECNSKDS